MEIIRKYSWFDRCMIAVFGVLLSVLIVNLAFPLSALAASDSLEITGDGVTNPVVFSLEDLKKMKQHRYVYSSINTWPTKKWYVGEGVKLWDLLVKAGIKKDEAKLLRFTSIDGYTVNLTMKELFQDKRYCFPNFKFGGNDSDGHIPGDPSGKVEVEPIIALVSVEGSNNPEYMNTLNTLLFMLGQRAVTEQTGNLFVKYLSKIEVLTENPGKWDAPKANPPAGIVAPGTMVTLSNLHNDDDKIYYTTDGSTPNLNSPIYNWIASRWWSTRADVLGKINRPIGPIYEDTTIKAVTIGPGKEDSEVVTYIYRVSDVPGTSDTAGATSLKIIKLTIGKMEASINGTPYNMDAAPYLDTGAGRTLVPVRFVSEALGGKVKWDPETRRIVITDVNKEIILTLGSKEVQVNGVKEKIDCDPTTRPPGRTFIPLRFVTETLGARVDYSPENGGIYIIR
jgi:hypothetical protein